MCGGKLFYCQNIGLFSASDSMPTSVARWILNLIFMGVVFRCRAPFHII